MGFALRFIFLSALVLVAACAREQGSQQILRPPVTDGAIVVADVSYLQMGEFSEQAEAEQLLNRIETIGVPAFIVQADGVYQVKSGPYADADKALRRKREIDRLLNIEARVVFE